MCLVFIRDGSTRCGLFICAQAAMEKVKAEQQVDLYYPMMMAKLRRPQFVPAIVSNIFIEQSNRSLIIWAGKCA